MYGFANTVEVEDSSAVDQFEALEGCLELEGAVELLQALDVSTDKIRGLVAGWALRKAGLD